MCTLLTLIKEKLKQLSTSEQQTKSKQVEERKWKLQQKSMKLKQETIGILNKIKSCFFEKINEIDKIYTLINRAIQEAWITIIRNRRSIINSDPMGIKGKLTMNNFMYTKLITYQLVLFFDKTTNS